MVNSLKGINLNNPFENKLDKVIEYFVKFYGEKYRGQITDRLNSAIYVFVDSDSENRIKLANDYFKEREQLLLDEFCEDAQKILNLKDKPLPLTFPLISNLEVWEKEINEDDYAKIYMLLKTLAGEKIPDISFKNMEKTFKNAYFSNKNQISSTIKMIAQLYKDKYEQRFLSLYDEKKHALTPQKHYSKNFEDKKERNNLTAIEIMKKRIDFSSEIDFDEFFPVIKKWVLSGATSLNKRDIKKINELEQILAKKNISFEQMKSNIFQNEICQKMKEIEDAQNSELSYYLNGYSDNLFKIYDANILFEKEIVYSIQQFVNFKSCAGYIFPTLRYHRQEQTTNVCVLGTFFSLIDSCAVHELNHIVESKNLLKNGVFYSKTGFFRTKEQLSKGQQQSSHNEIDEIFNEYISLKIYDLMRKDNFTLGAIGYKRTTYSYAFPAFEKLIEENLQDVIDTRMSDDPDAFAKKIGKENFENLSKIAYNLLHISTKNNFNATMKAIEKEIDEKAPNAELCDIDLKEDWSEPTLKYLKNIKKAEEIRKIIAQNKEKSAETDVNSDKGDYYV